MLNYLWLQLVWRDLEASLGESTEANEQAVERMEDEALLLDPGSSCVPQVSQSKLIRERHILIADFIFGSWLAIASAGFALVLD